MSTRAISLSAITLIACGANVVFVDEGGAPGDGGGGASPATTTTTTTTTTGGGGEGDAFARYCEAVDGADATCGGTFDLDACLASRDCALSMVRPDALEPLLDCLADNVCFEDPWDECVRNGAVAGLPLTPFGEAFKADCIRATCEANPYCTLPSWMTDGALAAQEPCLHNVTPNCSVNTSCFLQTPAGDCLDWIARAGLF